MADLPQNGRDREMQGAMQAKAEANLGVIKYRSSRANVVVVGYFQCSKSNNRFRSYRLRINFLSLGQDSKES